jgi:hypothetical protein
MDTTSQLFVAVGPPSDEDDDVEYVEANAREVAAWLHAHPAETVEIVRGLKVADPWLGYEAEDGGVGGWRSHPANEWSHLAHYTNFEEPNGIAVEVLHEHVGYFPTIDAAKAAADAARREAGWSLA